MFYVFFSFFYFHFCIRIVELDHSKKICLIEIFLFSYTCVRVPYIFLFGYLMIFVQIPVQKKKVLNEKGREKQHWLCFFRMEENLLCFKAFIVFCSFIINLVWTHIFLSNLVIFVNSNIYLFNQIYHSSKMLFFHLWFIFNYLLSFLHRGKCVMK